MTEADIIQIVRISVIATFWLLFFWCIVSSIWTSFVSRKIRSFMEERKIIDDAVDKRLNALESKDGRNAHNSDNRST